TTRPSSPVRACSRWPSSRPSPTSGVGYVTDGLGKTLTAHYDHDVSAFTFVGEVVLILWLLIKGWRARPATPSS
ncbi:MAG: hypothetical protein ACRELB_18840, partial [Polyangiaceae bacterium]